MRRTPLSREWADRNMAPPFLAVNGNKKSLTLDLQKPAARDIVLKLAAKADVVMENFRAGVMDRLGLGYEALSEVNPKLIYCAISGFGQTGPSSNRGGLRRQDPGNVRDHGDHRPCRDGANPSGFCRVRRAVRRNRGVRDLIRVVSTHPYRQGPVPRCFDAGSKPRVPDDSGGGLHRRGPSPTPGRQPGDQPQGHRKFVPRKGQLFVACRQRRETVSRLDDHAGAPRRVPGSPFQRLVRPQGE